MAFEQITDLTCEVTTGLGGLNKKTGKQNPTQAEGYYLGTKSVKTDRNTSQLHILLTPEGSLGVWGRTDLDRKMKNVTPGIYVRLTQNGKAETPRGEMYKYVVEVDRANTMDVSLVASNPVVAQNDSSDAEYEEPAEIEEDEVQEYVPPRATAPKAPASAPNKEQQQRVQDLLNKTRRTL